MGNRDEILAMFRHKRESFFRESERQKDLEHERAKAAIHAQARALVWNGTSEELTETIRRWYESGWLAADSLEDALHKAGTHFVRADGTPALKPASIAPTARESARFKPLDESYQVIEFDGRQYALTPTQSTVIRVLHKAHLEKRASVGISEIQKALRVNSGKISGWFRDRANKQLYGKLIVQTASRTHYRLDL
jgi:hypothetical protein